jgi:hypothetical protein
MLQSWLQVSKFDDPQEACYSVVAESYRLWLQYDSRTDDITMMVIHIVGLEDEAPQLAMPTPIGFVQHPLFLSAGGATHGTDTLAAGCCRAPWEYSQRAVASKTSVRSRRRPIIELGAGMLDNDDDKVSAVRDS